MTKKIEVDIQREAAALVSKEKNDWEQAVAFVTEKVAFQMRNLIRQLRKNYWGIFDKPVDPVTGRRKIFIPLTESLVESVVKNIDLDTKDINIRAKKPDAIRLASVIRGLVKSNLEEIQFGEKLDKFERQLAIDGTAVWKTIETKGSEGQVQMDIRNVDLLNFYIDPTVDSIQEAPSVIERAVMTIDEVKGMTGWINTDKVKGEKDIDRVDGEFQLNTNTGGETPLVEVFERWGKMPKSFITGKKEDADTLVDGRIVVSGLGDASIVHLIEKNDKGVKPYEEAWLRRVPGRWYGRGIAEQVMMLQLYLNTIVNIRINRSYVSQLGIFKIKKNRGITPQMVSKLAANGAILVDDQDDIQQLVMTEASQASYTDESVIQTWSQRVTQAFEAATGEALPASTTATVGAIQSRSAQSHFTLVKEGVGQFLQRWMKRHGLPIMIKNTSKGDVLRVSGSVDELAEIDRSIALDIAAKELEKANKNRVIIDQADLERKINMAVKKMKSQKGDRYFKLDKDVDVTRFDIHVQITNEDLDKSVMLQNLISMLNVAPEFKDQIVKQSFDLMGLDLKEVKAIPVQTGQNVGNSRANSIDAMTQAMTQEPGGLPA